MQLITSVASCDTKENMSRNMKTNLFKSKAVGSIIVAVIMSTIPLMAQAVDVKSTNFSSRASDREEIASLKRQLYMCRHHKRKHHRSHNVQRVIENRVVIQKPQIIERERIVEKQVFVDRPTIVERQVEQQVVLEQPMERRVVVEHAARHKHLLHFGIPFIGINLF